MTTKLDEGKDMQFDQAVNEYNIILNGQNGHSCYLLRKKDDVDNMHA